MNKFWLVFGFVGQCMFTMRFIIQWIVSEKAKKSIIPNAFWIFSILGSSMLFIYAVYRKDPVFILGQSFGSIIYIRNIVLILRAKKTQKVEGEKV